MPCWVSSFVMLGVIACYAGCHLLYAGRRVVFCWAYFLSRWILFWHAGCHLWRCIYGCYAGCHCCFAWYYSAMLGAIFVALNVWLLCWVSLLLCWVCQFCDAGCHVCYAGNHVCYDGCHFPCCVGSYTPVLRPVLAAAPWVVPLPRIRPRPAQGPPKACPKPFCNIPSTPR